MSSPSRLIAALVDRGPGADPSSFYVHVPFCVDRCTYCAFPTLSDVTSLHGPLVDALVAEAESRPASGPINTLYLGGGTPALLAPSHLYRLISRLGSIFSWGTRPEVTLEANPSNVTTASLRDWGSLGINRLSIGIQTFRDDVLADLGRRHDASDSRRALGLVAEHWPSSWSADLLMGWHGQGTDDVARDLESLGAFSPPHLSVYGLTIEPFTPLAWQQSRGHVVSVSRPAQARLDGHWSRWLGEHGYERYEISNFARPGHRSRHNQAYWANRSYIGLGPGAASSVHPHRWVNRTDLPGYIAAAATAGRGTRSAAERVDPFPRLLESLSIGLRVREGLALAELDARFSPAWRQLLAARGAELLCTGILTVTAGRLAIHAEGFVKVDSIIAELVTRLAADPADGALEPDARPYANLAS